MAKQAAFEPRQLAIGSTPQEQPQSKSVFGRAMVWPSSRGQGRPSPAFDHAGRTAGAGGSARARPKGATGRSPCRAHCRGQTPLGMAGAATSFVGKWPPGACRHRAAHRPTSDGPAGCWVALRTERRARAAQVSTRGCGATARARHRLRLLHWLSMRRLGSAEMPMRGLSFEDVVVHPACRSAEYSPRWALPFETTFARLPPSVAADGYVRRWFRVESPISRGRPSAGCVVPAGRPPSSLG